MVASGLASSPRRALPAAQVSSAQTARGAEGQAREEFHVRTCKGCAEAPFVRRPGAEGWGEGGVRANAHPRGEAGAQSTAKPPNHLFGLGIEPPRLAIRPRDHHR